MSLYVNDILNIDVDGNIWAFADDTVLLFIGDKRNLVKRLILNF